MGMFERHQSMQREKKMLKKMVGENEILNARFNVDLYRL